MDHLMIDLETLGTKYNAPVIAIGAIFFEPATGALGGKFYGAIDLAEACRYGVPSGDTIRWWMQQSDDARAGVIKGKHPSKFVFERFRDFCKKNCDPKSLKPWGNGATFDISILDFAFPRVLGEAPPWEFWNVRDCRTIRALAGSRINVGAVKGVAHNALDDSIHQAKWVSEAWQVLNGKALPAAADADII